MNILRLPTFASTIVLFAMGVLIMPANTALAEHCKGKHKNDPGCDDPGGEPVAVEYTVELFGRIFHFDQVDVVPDKNREHLLPDPADVLTFTRPDDADQDAQDIWDAIFASCENLFAPPVVPWFEVSGSNWRIGKPGGVRVQMGQIPFDIDSNPLSHDANGNVEGDQHFHVSLQLIGDTLFGNPNDTFLPVPVDSNPVEVEYEMIQSSILGRTEKGVRPKTGCVSGGSADPTIFTAGTESTLLITATATE